MGKETSAAVQLPQLSEHGYYEIRLESIGGLGANVCGKLLGQLGASLGLSASAFSSYGSEKRGSPVKAYVRWAAPEREILHNSPVERPQLLGLFHRALAQTYPVLAGVGESCTLVVNTEESPEQTRHRLRLRAGTLCCVDAQALAQESGSRVNMVMLGAMVRAAGFLPPEPVKALVAETLGKKYPALLKANLQGLELGWQKLKTVRFPADGRYEELPYEEVRSHWGYENAPPGGQNPHRGSTVTNDLSASREGFFPLFQPEKCIHCGLCDSTCPDMVFQFTPGVYRDKPAWLNRGLDYRHCKGCLRCVELCPTGALVAAQEAGHGDKDHFVQNKDLLFPPADYTLWGADPSIEGEAYLQERKPEGGVR